MNNFSAFKLFYEEFIYKRNIMVDYNLIENNIDNIKKILFAINDLTKNDKDFYLKKIEKYNKSLKKELDSIMDTYPYFYELYYVLYKRNVESYDEFKDMPLVISCSFYNDFQDMDKTYISRYTSKEKRQFRSDAKNMGYINYFIKVLKERNKEYLNILIDELVEFTTKKIQVKDSFQEVKNSFSTLYKSINNQLKRCVYNAKLCEDYVIVKDIMEIAFKDRVNSIEEFDTKLDDYLLVKYNLLLNSSNNVLNNYSYNYISYKEFKKIIKEERRAKNKYSEEFNINGVISYEESSYLNDFRESIILNYFDYRQKDDKQFDSLASDIPEWLFNYKRFMAMYSNKLNRDKNIRYALLNNIYELYNPYKVYDVVKDKYGKEINKSLKNKLRDFFISNYRDNLVSKTDKYDTREYDLTVILDIFDTDELLDIYNSIKPNSDEVNIIAVLFSNCIAKSIGNDNPSEEIIYDIAFKYLNVRLGVLTKDLVSDLEKYNMLYESFLLDSSFEKLKRGL